MNQNLPIGIDIQCDGIRALQLMSNHQGLNVRASAHLPLKDPLTGSGEDLEALTPLVRALAGLRTFKGRRIVVSLPHEYLYVFPVTIEITGHTPFETVLAQACGKHLSFPLEQAVIDYFCVEKTDAESGRKLRVTVVAAHREQVHKVIHTFKQARLSVEIIDYGLCGLIRLHNHIHTLTEAPVVLVHMDMASTLLAVATKTTIVAHRQLDWGMGRLEQRIAEMLQLDTEGDQGRTMLKNYGVDYDGLQNTDGPPEKGALQPHGDDIAAMRVVSQILAPNMEELVQELFQVIGYARSVSHQIQFQELWLYGRANEIKNMGPFLKKHLGFPAHQMDPFKKLGLGHGDLFEGGDANAYIHALGLTLRGLT